MIRVLVSLLITLLISLGIGFVLSDLLGFWQGFVGTIIIQFFVFYFTSSRKTQQVESQPSFEEEIIGLQTVPISCPCGKSTFSAPVFFNTENAFTCEKCGSKFKVDVTYDTILLTEPLNIENVFNQLKQKEL